MLLGAALALTAACGDGDGGGAPADLDVEGVVQRAALLRLRVPPANVGPGLRDAACGEDPIEAAILDKGPEGARLMVAVAHAACPAYLDTLVAGLTATAPDRGEEADEPADWVALLDEAFGAAGGGEGPDAG